MPLISKEMIESMDMPTSKENAVYTKNTFFPMILSVNETVRKAVSERIWTEDYSVAGLLKDLNARVLDLQFEKELRSFNTPIDLQTEKEFIL